MPPSLTSAQLDFIGVLRKEKNDFISRFLLVFILKEITLPVYCTTALLSSQGRLFCAGTRDSGAKLQS